jgi:hypothetical protein
LPLRLLLSWLRAYPVRWWRGALELAVYAVASLVVIWPVTMHLTSSIVGTGDGEFYLWLGWRLAEGVKHGVLPITISGALYPETYHVAWGDGYGAYLLLAFWNLLVNPYFAVNLTVLTALMANFLSARRVVRLVAPEHRSVWILGALAYGTAPEILVRLYGHYHLLFAFVPPLVLGEAVLFVRGERRLRVVRVGLLLAAGFYLSVYWFATSIAALVVFVLAASLRSQHFRGPILRLVGALAIAVVLTAPLTIPRIGFDHREAAATPPHSLQEIDNQNNSLRFSADALSVVAQPSASRIGLPGAGRLHRNFFPNRVESTIFPGALLVLALFVAAFVRSPLRLPTLSAAALVWILALGPTLYVDGKAVLKHANGTPVEFMPENLFYSLPGTSALRTPDRLAFALPAVTVIAFALAARWVCARARLQWQLIGGAVAAGLIVTNLIVVPYATSSLPGSLVAGLQRVRSESTGSDTVVEVPFDAGGEFIQTARFQLIHRRPMLGFHAQHSALPWFSDFTAYKQSSALAEIRCFPPLIGYAPAPYPVDLRPTQDVLGALRREFHVRFLLVNEQLLARSYCDRRRAYIESIISRGRVIARDRDWRIVKIR